MKNELYSKRMSAAAHCGWTVLSKAAKWAANARLNRIHRIARVRNYNIISLSMVHA